MGVELVLFCFQLLLELTYGTWVIQCVPQKSILKKVKPNFEKTLNLFNLNFRLAEGTFIQLSTVKISFRKKTSSLRYGASSIPSWRLKKVVIENFQSKKAN